MKINNWELVKRIIIAGLSANESFETIGLTIIDNEDRLNVIRINDRWNLMDEDGTVGKFNTPAEAWTFVGRICTEEYLEEMKK